MRVRYVPITEKEWSLHIQRGGFVGVPYQRGAGLGSIFRAIFRAILPVARSAGKAVGRKALSAGAAMASDLLDGRSVRETFENRGRRAASDLLREASDGMDEPKQKGRKVQAGGKLGARSIKGGKKPVKRKRKVTKDQLGTIYT